MGAEVVRINQPEGKRIEFPVNKELKLTKDGKIKKTYSSSYKGQSRTVYPFKTQKELQDMMNYFLENKKYNYYLLFVLGVNLGRRIGDTLELRWENFFFKNGKIRPRILPILEEKTDKLASPIINEACKKAIEKYLELTKTEIDEENYQDYVFKGLTKGTHLSAEAYRVNLKQAAEACGIEQNIGTHSPRKTMGYWTRQLHQNDQDSMILLRQIYNHSSTTVTESYIGLTDEKVEKYYNDMGDFFVNHVMDSKQYTAENKVDDIISISQDTLRDIIKMVYQDGINNARETDSNTHVEAIDAAMEIIMDSVI